MAIDILGVVLIVFGTIQVILSKTGLINKFFNRFKGKSIKSEKLRELTTMEGMMEISIGSLGIIFHSISVIILSFIIGYSIISYLYVKNMKS